MPKYVVSTYNIKPEELFSKLEGLEGVVIISSEKTGESVGLAQIESEMAVKDIRQQLGYGALVIIDLIRKGHKIS